MLGLGTGAAGQLQKHWLLSGANLLAMHWLERSSRWAGPYSDENRRPPQADEGATLEAHLEGNLYGLASLWRHMRI